MLGGRMKLGKEKKKYLIFQPLRKASKQIPSRSKTKLSHSITNEYLLGFASHREQLKSSLDTPDVQLQLYDSRWEDCA